VSGDWQIVRIADIAAREKNALVGGPFGSNLVSKDYALEGVPVIRGQNMGTGRWVGGEFAYVSQVKAKELSANIARPGDIVFTQRGTLGQVSIVSRIGFEEYVISQSQLKLTIDTQKADTLYVYYVFTSSEQQNYIRNNSIQTGVPHTNLGILKETLIPLPPLEIQQKIASILGALDDKIELNRRMNATLERIAQTLFKSWFVDFDPVKAKAAGLEPEGLDADTAALFPSGFQTLSLGDVPEGWELAELSEICEINPTRKLPRTGLAPYLDMGNMPTEGSRAIDWYDREIGSGAKFINGDTLFARITPCLENGKTAFVDFLENGQVGWGSTEYIVLRPKAPFPLEYAYILARDENFRSHAVQSMTGSSGRQRASAEALGRYLVAVPSNEILKRYGDILDGVFKVIKSRDEESKRLVTIRDSLLPKLLSDEIDSLGLF
jgi:type I restriction enzyme, S subunit